MNNITATPSRPNNGELGALFGDTIEDYEEGDCFEVAVIKSNGVRLVYRFEPFPDHRVGLREISYSGTSPDEEEK